MSKNSKFRTVAPIRLAALVLTLALTFGIALQPAPATGNGKATASAPTLPVAAAPAAWANPLDVPSRLLEFTREPGVRPATSLVLILVLICV